jgi:hypothetical protein
MATSFGDQPIWPPMYKPATYDAMVFTETSANGQHYYAMDSVGHVFCIDSPTACIQEAINYVLSNPLGGKVYIKRGMYNLSTSNLQSFCNNYMFIGVGLSPGQTLIVEGDGADTVINIPTLPGSGSYYVFQLYNNGCPSNGYQGPRAFLRHLKIVNNNTNSNATAGGILHNYDSSSSSAIGPEIEDIEIYNPQNTPMVGMYIGACGCPNGTAPYGVVVDKYRYITQNSGSKGDLALGIDSVTHAMLSNSFLYSSTVNGWFNRAFWNGTGELQIDNTAVYGFEYVFSGAADDGLSSYIVSNSVIGLNRFGRQTLDNAANSLAVNGVNGYLIGGLNASGSTLHVLISNSHIDFNTYNTIASTQPANLYLRVVNSELGGGSLNIWLASGSYINAWIENSTLGTNGCDGVLTTGGNTISGRIVLKNNVMGGQVCADTLHFFLPGHPGVDFIAEDNTINVTRLANTGYLGALFYHNGANRYIIRRNRISVNNGSSSSPYYYGLLYGGSSSSPVSWPNWPAVEITDNIIVSGTINQLIGIPGSGNNPGYISGSPLVARNYGVSAIYPTVSTPSVPSSDTAQSNTYPYPVDVYVSGGSATAVQVTRQGATYTVWSSSSATAIPPLLVRLEPGDSITITYSSAPSWTWVPAKANYGA